MKSKPAILFVVFYVFLMSCSHKDIDFIICPDFEVRFCTVIFRNQKDVSNQYKHAYGVGKELKKIFITENNYYYYKGKLVDSFFYGLPSNSLLDTARFCLVRMDNSLDTVGLTYHRNFYVGHACGYRYKLSDVKIFELSRRFQKDSCYVSDSLSYFHAVDDKRLVLAIKS